MWEVGFGDRLRQTIKVVGVKVQLLERVAKLGKVVGQRHKAHSAYAQRLEVVERGNLRTEVDTLKHRVHIAEKRERLEVSEVLDLYGDAILGVEVA